MGNGIYFKIEAVSGDTVHQPTWLLLLKIEHMVKLQALGNNSKTVSNTLETEGEVRCSG
jgi:hypothetical protein